MAAATTRAQRIDAGRVDITGRDRGVLAFITDHGGVRADTLALVLGRLADRGDRLAPARSPRAVSLWCDRMSRAGLVRREAILAQPWVLVTLAGARLVTGRERAGHVTDHMAGHVHATAQLRLWLQARQEATWTPEWRLRAEWRGRVRRPDGLLQWGDGYCAGVEVELTPKRSDRYARIVAEQHRSLHAVWWFTPAPLVPRLRRLLARPGAPARPVHKVFELPEGVTR